MSKKNNISYIKPRDPSFLQKIKADIGYKEGPTVDTKRQKISDSDEEYHSGDERPELEEEKPQIVVLNEGDLTAEEAEKEKRRLELEESTKPADLNQRIIFKSKVKPVDPISSVINNRTDQSASTSTAQKHSCSDLKQKKNQHLKEVETDSKISHKRRKNIANVKLSFNHDDDGEEEEKDTS